jgi:hypothetical protein
METTARLTNKAVFMGSGNDPASPFDYRSGYHIGTERNLFIRVASV